MRKFFLLLLLSCLHANEMVESASEHNALLASFLLGKENACNFPEKEAGEEDIFEVAYAKIVTVIPEVENITNRESELLWAWFAKYPQSKTFFYENEDCPDNKIEYYSPTDASFNGKIVYVYGNCTKEIGVDGSGQNPVGLDLNESCLSEKDYGDIFVNLTVELRGKVKVEYDYEKTVYEEICYENGTCYCDKKIEEGKEEFEKDLYDERKFFVEAGENEITWLNPPLKKRLEGNATGKIILFARKMPFNISLFSQGNEIGSVLPYELSLKIGECSEKRVMKNFSPSGNIFIAVNNESVFPFQLVKRNASYIPFYLEFNWEENAGKKEFAVLLEDLFSSKKNITDNFSVRRPDPFMPEEEGAGMIIREGNDEQTPAAYPASRNVEEYPDFSSLAALIALPFILLLVRKFHD